MSIKSGGKKKRSILANYTGTSFLSAVLTIGTDFILPFQSCFYIIYFKLVRLSRSPEICICSSIKANIGDNRAKVQILLRIQMVLLSSQC